MYKNKEIKFAGVTFKKKNSIIDYHTITHQNDSNCILVG